MHPRLDRRRFLGSAAATAAFFALHDVAPLAGPDPIPSQDATGRPRILSMELLSGAPLGAMKAFYAKTLGLAILENTPERLTLEAGETRITFTASADLVGGRAPFYHFAFNIPESKILQALEWQKGRLAEVAGVTQYRGGSDQFMAMGDEYGLLLVMKRGRVIDFTSEPHNAVRVYRTSVSIRGQKAGTYGIADYPYAVGVQERCSCA